MRSIIDWSTLTDQKTFLTAVEYCLSDRAQVLQLFWNWGQGRSLPVYFWNPGSTTIQQLANTNGQCHLQPTEWQIDEVDVLQFLLHHSQPGIYLIEGVLETDSSGELSNSRLYQLANAYHQLNGAEQQHWVLLSEQVELPLNLQPLIPTLVNELPDRAQIQHLVIALLNQTQLTTSAPSEDRLIRACQGLPTGEIAIVLERLLPFVESIDQLAERLVIHKTEKLSGRGLEFIAEPDIPNAGGLDLLDARLERICTLFNPDAQKHYGLAFPRGMILWGPPGTGKSLSAKLAAKKMGTPLLAVDWNAIPDDKTLRFLLQTAEAMAPCILYFDDFEKGFDNFQGGDGGLSRRRTGKLLTWMQEHQSQVFVMATVNRLGMMPPELIRRFEEEIYFIDLPNEGARYDVFNLHLAKYFPDFAEAQRTGVSPWSDRQWRMLLVEDRLCTPAEIGNAVRRVAQEAFFRLSQAGRIGEPLSLVFEEMLEQRSQFTPSLEREEGAILEIRNKATFAKPASGPDVSIFARPQQELFE
jgi:hypothetical protein